MRGASRLGVFTLTMFTLVSVAQADLRGRDPYDGWIASSEFASHITCALGGPLVKASAAMFDACRATTFAKVTAH